MNTSDGAVDRELWGLSKASISSDPGPSCRVDVVCLFPVNTYM